MSRATINHVAEAAGVSIKSVSRVMNGEPHVSETVQTKVQQAIRDLGYVPNVAARSLAGSRSFAVATLFDNPSPAYIMKVQDGAYAACRRADFQLVVENIDTTGDFIPAFDAILKRRLDGMVVTPPASDSGPVLKRLEERNIPYVRISPVTFPGRSPSVSMDDASAAAEVAEHLWTLGHRRFGLINGPPLHGVSSRRRQGFLSALADHSPEPVLEAHGEFSFASGLASGLELLSRADRPTAIFATNDDMAAGVYAAAGQLGLTIPRDLSVVGFDDSWVAQSLWPLLTTVYQPIAEMADAAVSLLTRRPCGESETQILPHRLIERQSTATAVLEFRPQASSSTSKSYGFTGV